MGFFNNTAGRKNQKQHSGTLGGGPGLMCQSNRVKSSQHIGVIRGLDREGLEIKVVESGVHGNGL